MIAVFDIFKAKRGQEQTKRKHGERDNLVLRETVETPEETLVEVVTPVFINFQHDATLIARTGEMSLFAYRCLFGTLSPYAPVCIYVDGQFDVSFDVFLLGLALFTIPRASFLQL